VNDPDHLVIKVTDGTSRAYFVHFKREAPHDLVSMWKYERIITPQGGMLNARNKQIVDLAKSRIGMPPEENNGATQ
jgi:hypothetical protein